MPLPYSSSFRNHKKFYQKSIYNRNYSYNDSCAGSFGSRCYSSYSGYSTLPEKSEEKEVCNVWRDHIVLLLMYMYMLDPGGEISALMTTATATVRMFVAKHYFTHFLLRQRQKTVACFSHNHIRVGVILDAGCRERMSPV